MLVVVFAEPVLLGVLNVLVLQLLLLAVGVQV